MSSRPRSSTGHQQPAFPARNLHNAGGCWCTWPIAHPPLFVRQIRRCRGKARSRDPDIRRAPLHRPRSADRAERDGLGRQISRRSWHSCASRRTTRAISSRTATRSGPEDSSLSYRVIHHDATEGDVPLYELVPLMHREQGFLSPDYVPRGRVFDDRDPPTELMPAGAGSPAGADGRMAREAGSR